MKILEKILPQILLLVLIIILFFPFLFSTRLFPSFDQLLLLYPYSYQYLNQRSFLTSGVFSGFDAWASPSSWAGHWLYYFLIPGAAHFLDFISFYNIIIFFYVILTLIFSYLAARQIGFDKWVATLVSSVYIFGAYNLTWMGSNVTSASLFIFPSLIYFLLKFEANKNWLWPLLGGIFLGLGLTMSHPQFALIAIFGGFLFSLFLTFKDNRRTPNWIFLAVFFLIFSIGLGLSAFELMPEYRLTQLTARGPGLSFAQSQECALEVFDFVRYLIPNFNFGTGCGESVLYIGVLPLILALLAILNFIKNKEKLSEKKALFWIFLLAFSLLFSVKYSPLAFIFHYLPVWGSLRGPNRFVMLANFSLSVLSGYGFNWILENKRSIKEYRIFWWIKKVFFAFLFLVIAVNVLGLFKGLFIKLANSYFDKYYYYQKTTGLPMKHYHRVIENLINSNFYVFNFSNKNFLIPFILAVAAFLIIIFIHKFNKTTLFYAFLLSGFVWATTSPTVSSDFTRDFFKETEIVRFLKEQNDTFRIYSLLPNLATYQLVAVAQYSNQDDEAEFFKTMLPVNLNLIYNLDSIDGLETSIPRRVSRLLMELLSDRANFGNRIAEARIKLEEKLKIFGSRANILSMMNVKYIISAYPLDEKIFKKVFISHATRFNIPIFIYENKNILPRFYFAKAVKSVEPDETGALGKILAPDIDFKNFSFIECGNDCGQNFSGKIIGYDYKNEYLRLNTESQTGGWIIFSESFSPYWSARINSKSVSIYRANYVYQAVKTPAGKNIVEFIYKPKMKL